MKRKLKELVLSAKCGVLSAKKMLAVALCAVGLSAFAEPDAVQLWEDVPEIATVTPEGELDLTVGARIAKDVETLVVDPAWGGVAEAEVEIKGEDAVRTYTCASNDLWQTASLTPGQKYKLALTGGTLDEKAAFWKVGADWIVFNSSNVTADATIAAGAGCLVLGTNTVAAGRTLTFDDRVKFVYDDDPTACFRGETAFPKRYEKKMVGDDLYQIVEKIKGCEDNPWDVGADGKGNFVTAWTNGAELVVGGTGTVDDVSMIADPVKGGLAAITVTEATVKDVLTDALRGIGTVADPVALSLPDGWQGDLPTNAEGQVALEGSWYGAQVVLTAWPLAVRNVKFQQRYPWNGQVDVTFSLVGTGWVQVAALLTTNGVTVCSSAAGNLTGEKTVDLGAEGGVTNGLKLVWNVKADLNASGISIFRSTRAKIRLTVKKYVPPPPKKHTVAVTLKSQSGAPVAGKVVFRGAEIQIGKDGTGSGEVPEGTGTWTVDAQYCATTPTAPTESTIDQDDMTINLTVQRQTKNVDVVALYENISPHPPVPNATITGVLCGDDYAFYGDEMTVTADKDGKAQFNNVELGLGICVEGGGSIWVKEHNNGEGATLPVVCVTELTPDEISEDGVKELFFAYYGGE